MEKYGTIPPRFTKAWWSHYWYYYKFHFIAIVCAIIMVASFIHHIVTEIHYDLKVQVIASTPILDESIELLNKKISELSADVNENGKVETIVYHQPLLDTSPQNAEYLSAIGTKIMADLTIGDHYIYVGDKAFVENYGASGSFMPVSQWAGNISSDKIYNDVAYSLSENASFNDAGINPEDLYIMVLHLYQAKKDDAEEIKAHENALNTALSLIKE